MKTIEDYSSFIKKTGKPLNELNPGSSELALSVKDAFKALSILREIKIPAYGGDVLLEESKKLRYAYQVLGSAYIYLNWSVESKKNNETEEEYLKRSYYQSENAINVAARITGDLGHVALIVLVTPVS